MSEERSQGRTISIDEGQVKSQLDEVVGETVGQTLYDIYLAGVSVGLDLP